MERQLAEAIVKRIMDRRSTTDITAELVEGEGEDGYAVSVRNDHARLKTVIRTRAQWGTLKRNVWWFCDVRGDVV